MQKEQFSTFMLYFESNPGRHACVENGAMLTIYSDILQNAPFRSQISRKKIRLRQQGGIEPPNQNPADVPVQK